MPDITLKGWSGAEWLYPNVPKVWLATSNGEDLTPFTYGEAVTKTVVPNFSEGDMVVPLSEGELVTDLTIRQPENLRPENIPKDMYIAGVGPGTFEGGMLDAPQLGPPSSAYVTTSQDRKVINVYDDGYNGRFSRQVQILSEDGSVTLAESSVRTTTGTVAFYGYDFSIKPAVMPFRVCARIVGEKFIPSDQVAVSTSLFLVEILRSLTNCDLSQPYEFLFAGDAITLTLVPTEGYYYPKTLLIEPSEGDIVYTYNALTGLITIPSIPQVSHIRLSTEAPNMPWLQNPVLEYDNQAITVEFLDSNAESTPVKCDGETLLELVDGQTGYMSHSVESVGSYGFVLQSDGYYKENSGGGTSRAALCKVTLNMKTAGTVNFSVVNYGYSSYDYGIVGKVDKVLSNSYSTDIGTSSANVYTTYKSSNVTTVKTLSLSVPAGEHFVYFKYRRYYQSSTSYYFKFKVTSVPATPSRYELSDYVEAYGEYNLTVQSIAEGYTPSDSLHYVYIHAPVISVANAVIHIKNLNSYVTHVDLVIDGEQVTALEHDGSGEISHDLTQYSLSIARHTVYVDAALNTGAVCRSNILEDEPLFVYSPFSSASWEEISQVAKTGLAGKCYKTTDTKTLLYRSSMGITVSPAGFNHDDKADGSGKAGLSLISINVPALTLTSNASLPTSSTMLADLPAELRPLVCPVLKEFDASFNGGDNTTQLQTCSVFIPSINELGLTMDDVSTSAGSRDTYLNDLGECYEKYAVTACSNRKTNSSGTYVNWLTRTAWHAGTKNQYVYGSTATAGSLWPFATTTSKSYAFGFCLG